VQTASRRIDSLDGLRGIAVIGVLLYHYFVRWGDPSRGVLLYPWGDQWSGFALFEAGQYGVELFFVISGFVIAMTLTRCSGILEFAIRRYARLGPAMLVFAPLTFLVSAWGGIEQFRTSPSSVAFAMTFIDPDLVNALFQTSFRSVDGVYWSLYVEVQFYALISVIYFMRPRQSLPLFALVSSLAVLSLVCRIPVADGIAERLLSARQIPWFLMGMAFHARFIDRTSQRWIPSLCLALVQLGALSLFDKDWGLFRASLIIPLLFAAAEELPLARRVLSSPLVCRVGVASYGLYLVHQYVGVTILHRLPSSSFSSKWLALVAVAGLITLLCMVARLSYRYIETPLGRLITGSLLRRRLPATT